MPSLKILIIRLSSIGDILLSTAFIRQLRSKYPEIQIDYLIKHEFGDLIKYNPHLNNIYMYKTKTGRTGLKSISEILKKNAYTHILDLHNNYRSKYIRSRLKNTIQFHISKDKLKRFILVNFKMNFYQRVISIPDRYRNVGQKLQVEDDEKGLELYWNDNLEKKIDKLQNNLNIELPFIAMAPGAGHFTKRWPMDNFRKLIGKLNRIKNANIIILGSQEEHSEFKQLSKKNDAINLAGKLSLLESAAILKRSNVLISNDSGLMHMATAVGTPVIAIFGSTVKELGFFPFRGTNYVFEHTNVSCRPCSHLGKKKCPKGHFECMRKTKPEMVFNKINELIG